MEAFTVLFEKIDQTKSTNDKVFYIQQYFESVSSDEAAWGLYFLSGNKIKRLVGSAKLFDWGIEASGLPPWICSEAYGAVGDVAETIALILGNPNPKGYDLSLNSWITEKILPLQKLSAEEQKFKIFQYWQELDRRGIFILNKILTGSLRVGVSHLITLQALSKALGVSKETLSLKLMGNWIPSAEFFESLKEPGSFSRADLNPYPFYLASPLQEPLDDLGSPEKWFAEWKWDGIRSQCIVREGKVAIWSRGNELVTAQFPEIAEAVKLLGDGTVVDGEILAYRDDKPLPFGELQKRLGRKKVTKADIEKVPLALMLYDILEYQGHDIRSLPFAERRTLLENWNSIHERILISPHIPFDHWEKLRKKRVEASEHNTEGIMLKKMDSIYGIGRRRGSWWKFKIDPKTIDAVLIYAQPGQGWRANLYTDYTFGVWHNGELVPITKAYSGLSKEEINEMDKWIRKNTLEKFGPVRKVKPVQVFEIAFEGIQKSSRHKSGVAFRFPRIQRWRKDKPPEECDTLDSIRKEFLKES